MFAYTVLDQMVHIGAGNAKDDLDHRYEHWTRQAHCEVLRSAGMERRRDDANAREGARAHGLRQHLPLQARRHRSRAGRNGDRAGKRVVRPHRRDRQQRRRRLVCPLEFAEESTIDWQFDVNVRGPINVIRAILPHFRANKGGMIINISSFMGVTTAVPTGSLYNMSKFALEGLTEGLFYELKPLNIELRLVEPGGSKGNNFLENIVFNSHADITDYDAISAKVNAMFASIDPDRLDDPQEIVDEIYALATVANQQFRTLVGQTGKDLMALRRSSTIEEYLSTIAADFG